MDAAPQLPGRGRLRVSAGAAVLAVVAQTLIGLVLYGYLIRRIGAETVGVWVSLMAAGLLACTADLGLNFALIRQLSMAPRDTAGRVAQESVETLVWAAAVCSGAALLLVYLAFPFWSSWLTLTPDLREGAVRWLPYVLLGLWLNRVADALAGGLDGQQRFVERSAAGMGALLAGLLLTVACVPVWGMDGAAASFLAQNALLFGVNFALLARGTPGVRWLRPRLRLQVLREAARYGLSVQALVLCYLVLESGTKLLLAGSGNLTAVSYFDLTFRIGKGVRGLLASALRVLVPRLAPTGQSAQGLALRWSIYRSSFGVLLVVALPIFAGLLASVHAIAWVLVGRDDPMFVDALVYALLPWLAYSLTDPALNLSLASGRMGWPLRGHLVTVGLAAALAFLWWRHTSSNVGLYASVMFAMLAGCFITLAGVHRDEQMPWGLLKPGSTAMVLLGGLGAGLLGTGAPELLDGLRPVPRWCVVAAVYIGFLALLWRHPAARSLLGHARSGGRTSTRASTNDMVDDADPAHGMECHRQMKLGRRAPKAEIQRFASPRRESP